MENLTSPQRDTVNQLRDLTNGGDDEVNIGILESVDWDIQRAADVIFSVGGAPPPVSDPPKHKRMERMDIDDSAQGQTDDYSQRHGNEFPLNPRPSPILALLNYPFTLLSSVFRYIFSVLRIPFPHLPFLSLNFYSPTRPTRASSRGIDSWIRELEEETGGFYNGSTSTGVASGVAGPSSGTLAHRGAVQKQLPNFVVGTYEEILRRCQRENRVGCIVLVSEEHDDDAEFKRYTLTDPTFVSLLTDTNCIVWGGDVRDLEPYAASEKLQATTYPFVAFVANQPTRSSTSQKPTLTVLSRHAGAANTTPTKLVEHLTGNLLPRVQPYLERLLNAQRALEHDRILRQQQDLAFEDASRRDTDRIRAKMAQERAAEEERQAAARRAAEDALSRQREADERERLVKERMVWRRWARRCLAADESPSDKLRIAIRLPDGTRLTRRFGVDATVTELYAFVDKEFIPKEMSEVDDPVEAPSSGSLEGAIETMGGWGFKLLSSYPRAEVPWAAHTKLRDVPFLKDGGGQLIVEKESERRISGSDDGYETESDDE